MPHEPQLLPSFEKSTQPSAAQKFGVALGHEQAPETHDWAAGHAFLQLPQLALSVKKSTHPAAEQKSGVEDGQEQTPLTHVCADGHALLQLPQLALSPAKLTQTLPPPTALQMFGVELGQALVTLLVVSSSFTTVGEIDEGGTANVEPWTTPVATTAVDTGSVGLSSLTMDSETTTVVTCLLFL